ncbi:hypothetical protein E8E14_012666 [Neopestalotiopsis sp. 37M]|nr:hypothetical protein E8E14_012666 [Neopestalotiopsis sp. 37M]
MLVIGVDVGGTNTDAVLMRGKDILAWHKSPTTTDVSIGVSTVIQEVLQKTGTSPNDVTCVKVGTTKFLNASLERDGRKMDRVAVIRLCGPYTQSVAPFLSFPQATRQLVEGYYAYVEGGNHVNGKDIYPLSKTQLAQEAQTIKDKDIRSAVLIGVHSTSFPDQENEAAVFLSEQLGPGFDVSCSHHLGNAGFLERENTAILNASIRRFAASMIGGLVWTISQILPHAKLYMTLNDGTISQASYAAQYPLKCFASGPTNSARGAAFIGMETLRQHGHSQDDGGDLLVIDVGGTTTDVCSLLSNGYPKQSAAFVKLAGVKTNLSMPQIHNIALGGGSIVRQKDSGVTVGPDSVGADELTKSLAVGGTVFTAADSVKLTAERLQELGIPTEVALEAKHMIKQMIESAVEFTKTKPTDARVILVGGGSFVLPDVEQLKGVSALVRPKYYEVANAIGAAIAKVSGRVDRMIIPKQQSVDELVKEGKHEAIRLCREAGGRADSAEIVDLEIIPETYTFDGSFRLLVRAVSDIDDAASGLACEIEPELYDTVPIETESKPESLRNNTKVQEDVPQSQLDITTYHPAIFNDIWTLTETDIDLLVDGTGGSPTALYERLPGGEEMKEAIYANLQQVGKSDFSYTVPMEIGGPNALEALLLAAKTGKKVVDADLMGRAFPRVYMTIPSVMGKRVAPAAITDGDGTTVLLKDAKDDFQAEDILRSVSGQFGSIAALGIQPFRHDETHLFAQNSYSLAWSIGYNMRLARQQKADVASAVVAAAKGKVLFRGKVNLVSRQVRNSFTIGTCTILPETSENANTTSLTHLELIFENEILAAILKTGDSQTCLAATPDLMAIIDTAGGQALGITELKYGLQVDIIALRAPEIWYSDEALRRVGLAAFGIPDCPPSTLEPSPVPVSMFGALETPE